jgi:hypothetical protein
MGVSDAIESRTRVTNGSAPALLLCSLLGALVVLAPLGRASATPIALEVSSERSDSAADCASPSQLHEKVQALRQKDALASSTTHATLRVTARFDRRGSQYTADLKFDGAKHGERSFQDVGTNCDSLVDAVVVALVLLLDNQGDASAAPDAEPPPGSGHHDAPNIKGPHGLVSLSPLAAARPEWIWTARSGAAWGLAPSTTAWFGLDTGLAFRDQWQARWGGFMLLPRDVRRSPGEVSISLWAIEWRGCKFWGSSFWFGACAGTALGRLHGVGRQFDEDARVNLVWFAGSSALGFAVPLDRHWFFGAETTAWVPLGRQSFSVRNLGTVWNSSAILGGAALQLGVRLR